MFSAFVELMFSEKLIKIEFEDVTKNDCTKGFVVSLINVPITLKLSNQNLSARVEVYLQ